ncbi:MAG: molybdate transport system permease protein [Thermoplasmata archaeon]|jgi:ABC-type spermidine/putrescine transport system permease subunit II|nr:molybdate transport system permease protein [Thermoplasmata archaeon]
MTTLPAHERRAHATRTLEKSAWTVLVWALFALFILGPLLTVVAFSLTHNVFQGARPNSLEWYAQLLRDPQLYGPLLRSFEVALIVVMVQLVFGTLIAYSTVRGRIFGAGFLDALCNITIALPSVVIGLALLAFYGPFGPVSTFSTWVTGSPFTLTWTLAIVVFAHVLETFPYMVRSVTQGLQRMDANLESAARSLGGKPWHVFRTITLPQLRPALVSGGVLVLSRSIAEFGATIIVVSAVLSTAPVSIYSAAESGSMELAAAYSVILMLVSFTAYVIMNRWLLREENARGRAEGAP